MLSPDTPISGVEFSFLDFETTGISPRAGDRVCEVGIIRARKSEVIRSFSSLVNPGCPISAGATAIHGITEEMVESAPLFHDIADEVLSLLEDAVLVAHNAPFDLSFLSASLSSLRRSPPSVPVVDTLRLARRNYSFSSNSLPNLLASFGIEAEILHRALADALSAKRIFERMVAEFGGWESLTLGSLFEKQGGVLEIPFPQRIVLPEPLEEVLSSGMAVCIVYRTARGTLSRRIVEPKEVILGRDGAVYLVAKCLLRNAPRTFRFDRIIRMNTVGEEELIE